MLYCDKIEQLEDSAIYMYGYSPNKKPGMIQIFKDPGYKIIIPVDDYNPGHMWIRKMLAIHCDELQKGHFKEMLDYEA